MKRSYDVIVVGAGSSGCPLAARLSEDPRRSVLLLEAGPRFVGIEQYPPELRYGGVLSAMMPGHPNNWDMVATVRENLLQPLPRGRVVGGSSVLNGTLFTRGLPEDFDGWAAEGNPLWSYDQVLAFFTRLETDHDIHDEYHGAEGPVPVRRASADELVSVDHAFLAACKAAGFQPDPDMNGPKSIGAGLLPVNNIRGIRMNTALTYLDPARDRPNLVVQGDATVSRILFEGARAIGVEVVIAGQRSTIHGAEVVLSAGAIKSPQLLMCSGIGPAEELTRHGIKLLVESPLVGREFTDHCSIKLPFRAAGRRNRVSDPVKSAWAHTGLHYTSEIAGAHSDMMLMQSSISMNDSIFFDTSLAGKARIAGAALGKMSLRKMVDQARHGADHGITAVIMRGDSRGEIRLTSADPDAKPDLFYHYFESTRDLQRMREAFRLSAKLIDSEAYREIGAERSVLSDEELASDALLDRHLLQHAGTSVHMASSCRMGTTIERSVVDQYCRVHGVAGLRVIDSSIMPTVVRRCPAATAVMIGERAAAFFG